MNAVLDVVMAIRKDGRVRPVQMGRNRLIFANFMWVPFMHITLSVNLQLPTTPPCITYLNLLMA